MIMKKTALTFGLFSLVMVTTSFTTPTLPNSLNAKNTAIIIEIDLGGQAGRDGRKLDVQNTSSQLNSSNQSNSFSSSSQSARSTAKVD